MKKLIVCLFTVMIFLISVPVMATTVSLDVETDLWASETWFELIFDPSGANISLAFDLANPNDPQFADGFVTSGDLASYTLYMFDWNVGPGSYAFTIYDTWGDGICCVWGNGYYTLAVDSVPISTGGAFAYDETTEFSVVPEPATMLLLGSGLLGLGLLRKKFRKK